LNGEIALALMRHGIGRNDRVSRSVAVFTVRDSR